ncbi:hypothetical protein [Pedobacter punctiformis]|uniref:Lipoprotein n=1 Tax=Pedobacter punctiformis TaxID=3004097 RepID=A0ABT4L8S0_9SPHI|nr:hypothetical protein [Pedobacter sp. HCMS5-2]MCZ4244312.1 hypothetical protein [Pedobacter sp. HCMS5-2]
MKTLKFFVFGLSLGLAACQSSTNSNHKADSIASIESGPGKIVDERFLIVPGISIGKISIGEDMQEVFKKTGNADDGDAAMGKAWGIWYGKVSKGDRKDELAIYSAYRDSNMVVKEVKQIRITSGLYKTQDGFGTGRTLNDTKMKFPAMEILSAYLNPDKDTIFIYDSKPDGIGFEFVNKKSVALTVHPKQKSLNETYLTLHPEWKAVK